MEISDRTPRVSDIDVTHVASLLGEDGVMALKLVGANSSELLVRDVVSDIAGLARDGALATCGRLGTVIQQNPPTQPVTELTVAPGASHITDARLKTE